MQKLSETLQVTTIFPSPHTHYSLCFSGLSLADIVQENVEESLEVLRARHGLRVKLDAEEWLLGVHDSFVALVVGVDKERAPALVEGVGD